eukprot:GAHX01002334.1.p1 GENE.GAHX01002334.1~~GAHX01002334.1.p1  ORF type:complete len:210 (-),score=28.43 GAHX01002334.1:22-651(-)
MILSIALLLLLFHILQKEPSKPSYELIYSITDNPRYFKFEYKSKVISDDFTIVMLALRIHIFNNSHVLIYSILILEWKRIEYSCCSTSDIQSILQYYQNKVLCALRWEIFNVKYSTTKEVLMRCSIAIKTNKLKTYSGFKSFLDRLKTGIVLIYYYGNNTNMVGENEALDMKLVLVNKVVKIIDKKEGKIQYYVSVLKYNMDEIWIVIN